MSIARKFAMVAGGLLILGLFGYFSAYRSGAECTTRYLTLQSKMAKSDGDIARLGEADTARQCALNRERTKLIEEMSSFAAACDASGARAPGSRLNANADALLAVQKDIERKLCAGTVP